jgi:hypothetical protein
MQFTQIPNHVERLLTDEPVETVVLIVLDGFGRQLFDRVRDTHPFLQRFATDGLVISTHSQFPSTTAVQLTTLHTSLPIGSSGVVEWRYFDPASDRIVAPLPGLYQGDAADKPLTARALADCLPRATFYARLAARGIDSTCFQPRAYARSAYTRHVCRGAHQWPYRTPAECLVNLVHWLRTPPRTRRYAYVYFDAIDALAHRYGPCSPQVLAELTTLLTAFERILAPELARQRRLRLLVTADHGLTAVEDPVQYLDHLAPALEGMLRTTRTGQPIVPTGGKRDLFLHVQPERLAEAEALLLDRLDPTIRVARTATLIAEGLFGVVTPSTRPRLGDLIVLPGPGQRMWWAGGGRFALGPKRGDHGGLTADELEIPFLSLATD